MAYKIVESAKAQYGLSDKQRWAVAYGLMGSKEFKKRVALSVRVDKEARAERAAKKAAEKASKKAQKQSKPLSRSQRLGFPDFNLIKR